MVRRGAYNRRIASNLLNRLGLHRPQLRAWAMYDWAISPVQTTIMVALFPIYYIQVAGAGAGGTKAAQWWALSNGIAIAVVAVLSPILGVRGYHQRLPVGAEDGAIAFVKPLGRDADLSRRGASAFDASWRASNTSCTRAGSFFLP